MEQNKLKVPSITIRRQADVQNGEPSQYIACIRGPPAHVAIAKGLLAIVDPKVRNQASDSEKEVVYHHDG